MNPLKITSRNKTLGPKSDENVASISEFLKHKEETRNVEGIKPDQLNRYLCEFILKRQTKSWQGLRTIKLSSLFSIANLLLKGGKYPVNIIDDNELEHTKKWKLEGNNLNNNNNKAMK